MLTNMIAGNYQALASLRVLYLSRRNSKTPGKTEITMMTRMTKVKLSCTKGKLPKKYPPNVKRDTHSTAPVTLNKKKRG